MNDFKDAAPLEDEVLEDVNGGADYRPAPTPPELTCPDCGYKFRGSAAMERHKAYCHELAAAAKK